MLRRYPHRSHETRQAWDSADELILEYVAKLPLQDKRLLIINDSFGALACPLEAHHPTVYTDSYVSYRASELNSEGKIKPLSRLAELHGFYDIVLLRLPKNSSFLEDILCHIGPHLRPQSQIICGSMVKHLAKASFDLLNKYIGETSTSLAKKKARLIFANYTRDPHPSPYPLRVEIDGFEKPFVNFSNLFSREKLDIGTRFFLAHIPRGPFRTILDLGCANGIVGISAKRLNPGARLVFSDESRMAVESAEVNYSNYFSDSARFLWTHCYEGQESSSVDLVLCNPPFHRGEGLDDFTAHQMFQDAHRALAKGGLLRVIGNSHLAYPGALKRIFGNSQIIAKNQKFIITDAHRIT